MKYSAETNVNYYGCYLNIGHSA